MLVQNDNQGFTPQPGEGQPGAPESAQGSNPELSEVQIERLVERLANDPKLKRSLYQHTDAKIRQQMAQANNVIQMQREAGMEISPEQEEKIKQRIISKAYSQADPDEEPMQRNTAAQRQAAPGKPNSDDQQAIQKAYSQVAQEIFSEYGVRVERSDPEAAMVDMSGSVRKFSATMQAAAEAKAKRLQTSPQARIPSMGGQASGGANALQEQYQAELAKLPKGNPKALIDLRVKYRNMGLKI